MTDRTASHSIAHDNYPAPAQSGRRYHEEKASLCLRAALSEKKGAQAVLRRMAKLFKDKATPGLGRDWS